MKYKDLPSEKLVQKLIATSFESPTANRKVFDWSESVLKHIRFLENERIKLVQKYGDNDGNGNYSVPKSKVKEFMEEFTTILEMEINDKIIKCPVEPSWFDDNKCNYPKNKDLWISAVEISTLK